MSKEMVAQQFMAAICNLDVTDFNEQYPVYAYYSKKEYYGNVKNFIEFLTAHK